MWVEISRSGGRVKSRLSRNRRGGVKDSGRAIARVYVFKRERRGQQSEAIQQCRKIKRTTKREREKFDLSSCVVPTSLRYPPSSLCQFSFQLSCIERLGVTRNRDQ